MIVMGDGSMVCHLQTLDGGHLASGGTLNAMQAAAGNDARSAMPLYMGKINLI